MGTSGSSVQWTAGGGGFAASSLGPLTVNIGGGSALTWGGGVGSGLMGTLKFGSSSAANAVTFQNSLNLNGADRTVFVDDNTSSGSDYAAMTGIISNTSGTAGLEKTGPGRLVLATANTYNGATKISGGTLQIASLSNGGVASSIGMSTSAPGNLVFQGGSLQYTGPSVSTNRSFTVSNDLTIDTANALTFTGQMLTSSGAAPNLTKMGAGMLSLNNASGTLTLGTLNVPQGSLELAGGAFTLSSPNGLQAGVTDNSKNVLYLSGAATLTAPTLALGTGNYSHGVLYQSGSSTLRTATQGGNWNIGYLKGYAGNSGSGYWAFSGGSATNSGSGTLNVGYFEAGLVDQSGGTANFNSGFVLGNMYCYGVYNLSAGTATFSANHQQPILGTGNGYGSDYLPTGVLTISGTGRLTASAANMLLGNSANSVGIVNLGALGTGGGVLSTINLMRGANGGGGTSGGTALVNFHGGTLQAATSTVGNDPAGNPNTGLLIGTTNYVYGEGAVIDTNNHVVTIATALSMPGGNGVTGIPVTGGGSGYLGAPVVQISGGGGIGATANATINPATGIITGIAITNPGTGYTSAPMVTLQGGGGFGGNFGHDLARCKCVRRLDQDRQRPLEALRRQHLHRRDNGHRGHARLRRSAFVAYRTIHSCRRLAVFWR